mmetsp:Transcript_14604/g.27457  ORF Transcript_14604/g.27457 Transcript_14604/m.27457 type:complete len:501 (+) Transcript_14604:105-1607(+)
MPAINRPRRSTRFGSSKEEKEKFKDEIFDTDSDEESFKDDDYAQPSKFSPTNLKKIKKRRETQKENEEDDDGEPQKHLEKQQDDQENPIIPKRKRDPSATVLVGKTVSDSLSTSRPSEEIKRKKKDNDNASSLESSNRNDVEKPKTSSSSLIANMAPVDTKKLQPSIRDWKSKEDYQQIVSRNRESKSFVAAKSIGGGGGGGDDQENDNDNNDEEDEDDDDLVEQNVNKKAPLILIHEAWDNEELVGSMRVDPPESLWNKSDDWMEDNDDDHGGGGDDDDNVRYIPTKIHLFAIDWAAFKQIRSDDLLSYFKLYGPSYVEWLGELSCNIHFEDRFSASRALEALSRALPNEIPQKVVEEEEGEKKAISNTNLGLMGWRLCNHFIHKIRSDKFGKRGTRSRCIVRMATSLDVLEERPSTFPKPPPGYTTHRVLGPGSDFHKTYPRRDHGSGNRYDRRRRGRVEKRRRRHRSVSDDGMNHHHVEDDEFDQSAIDRALTAPRR